MKEMISYCGLDCLTCPAYEATRDNDDKKREKTAGYWSKLFGREIKAEEINCDGCLQKGGRLLFHCSDCAIRACGQEKDVKNCAYCNDYSCKKLDNLLSILPNPEARKNLERINKTTKGV